MTDSERLLRDLKETAKRVWNYDKQRYGVTPRYLSWLAINNPNLPARLEAGGHVRPATEKKLRSFMTAELGREPGAQARALRTKMRLSLGAVLGAHSAAAK